MFLNVGCLNKIKVTAIIKNFTQHQHCECGFQKWKTEFPKKEIYCVLRASFLQVFLTTLIAQSVQHLHEKYIWLKVRLS